jgi:hypothetical protein
MGIHSNPARKAEVLRMNGFKMTQRLDHVEVVPSRWNKAWPKLASRFQSLGVLKGFDVGARGATMAVGLELDVIEAMISGRQRKRRFPKVIGLGLLVPVLVFASLIPTKHGGDKRIPVKVSSAQSKSCSLDFVGRWLQGVDESEEIKILGTSMLGGVTAGTLECKGSRYSYTLGSEEPKRVLKLQKLDS